MRYLLIALAALGLTACDSKSSSPAELKGVAMTIPYRLLVGQALTQKEQQKVQAVVKEVFSEVDAVYNDWNPHSEISQLNKLEAGERRRVSPELSKLLQLTENIVTLTEGRFDPTVSPLQKLWRRHLEENQLPPEDALIAAQASVGWNKVHLVDDVFWKDHNLTRLDLGGVAKGYCVDLMIERLRAAGFPDIYFEWGGEIAATGQHPEGRPWGIYISALGDTQVGNAVATLALRDQAIATSGDYMQYWQQDGKTYFHIVDPLSLQPLEIKENSIASTSVLAPSCALADGLATALMMFHDAEEARRWAEKVQAKEGELSFWIQSRR